MIDYNRVSAIEHLDTILSSLTVVPKTLEQVCDLRSPNDAYKSYIKVVLKKLIRDGYATLDRHEISALLGKGFIDLYSISFEGQLFLQLGGYLEETKKMNSTNNRLKQIEETQLSLAKRQYWINIAIAVGAAIASIDYIIHVGQYFKFWH